MEAYADRLQPESADYLKHRYPSGPPPDLLPGARHMLDTEDAGGLFNFTHCMSYVWPSDADAFWIYPVRFSPTYIYGYGWNGSAWNPCRMSKASVRSYY